MIRLALVLAVTSIAARAGSTPLHFRICLDEAAAQKPVSGRLLVFLYPGGEKRDKLGAGFLPGKTWIAASEIRSLAPGGSIEFNPDAAYPKPLTEAPRGTWQVMALLDLDHSYAHSGLGKGDLLSEVTVVRDLDPPGAGEIKLCLTRAEPGPPVAEFGDSVKMFETGSERLTAFWGRRIVMRAGVVLPPGYAKDIHRFYPASYIVHPFVGNAAYALRNRAKTVIEEMTSGARPAMIHIYLDASIPTGHHAFADSVNNGPWGRALIDDLIPALEHNFRLIPRAPARFLTGHSSGGWSTLWLQVNYPDTFGGVWSTGPDPVDFRSFVGVDVSPGSTQNMYRDDAGDSVVLLRWKNRAEPPVLLRDFARHEMTLGETGGQFASFEWVFSPRGPDGRPMPLFDRVTGEQDPAVQRAWRKYDIRYQVERRWSTLGPKLKGKIKLIVGAEDNFGLDESAEAFCEFLADKGEDDACDFVEGRDHIDLYRPFDRFPGGLDLWIAQQMMRKYETAR